MAMQVKCVWATPYAGRLTEGETYEVDRFDQRRMMVFIIDDDFEVRAYPAELFLGGMEVGDEKVEKIDFEYSDYSEYLRGRIENEVENAELEATIKLRDGSVWGATFVCYEFIEHLRRHAGKLGHYMGGRIFSRPGLILFDQFNEQRIRAFIKWTVMHGYHPSHFNRKCEMEESKEQDDWNA